jgi:hypothetical protein
LNSLDVTDEACFPHIPARDRACLIAGAGTASAGTLVEFPNLAGHEPARLTGYLARPETGFSDILGGERGTNASDGPVDSEDCHERRLRIGCGNLKVVEGRSAVGATRPMPIRAGMAQSGGV